MIYEGLETRGFFLYSLLCVWPPLVPATRARDEMCLELQPNVSLICILRDTVGYFNIVI